MFIYATVPFSFTSTTDTMPRKAAPAYVIGVGMTKFIKPRGKVDYTELGFEAGIKAMLDAKITYDQVDQPPPVEFTEIFPEATG